MKLCKKKGIIAILLCMVLSATMSGMSGIDVMAADTSAVTMEEHTGSQQPFRLLDVDAMVAEMGNGWNLGNTMDGHTGFTPNETLWQNVETTQKLIDSVHNMGFNTVRIPVTWGTMINDEDYSINDTWINRVQDIVDYCISQDMYVIVNIHHDGAEQSGWLRIASDDIDSVKDKFTGVWTTIANKFRDYDEHLIFESMNEVVGDDNSETGINKDTKVIMELNQIFVDVIRNSGSNNAYRYLSVPGRYTNIENSTKESVGFTIPNDTVENRIFVAVHYYDWSFGMLENMNMTTWGPQSAASLQKDFIKLYNKFTSQGIPVILGEYGCVNKYNSADRAYHVEVVNRLCQMYGVVPVYWDNGYYDRSTDEADYCFTLVDRNTGESIDTLVTDALMRGFFVASQTDDLSDIVLSPDVTEIADVVGVADSYQLTIGDTLALDAQVQPSTANDVLLWSTDDASIATVYNGTIRARGIGQTVIHAASQSGSYTTDITITVQACNAADIVTISTDQTAYTVEAGKYIWIDAAVSDETAWLYYKSSNVDVATVSTQGKIVGKSAGTAYIIITASTGVTKVVAVEVTGAATASSIDLALNVYFNDSDTSYFSNEVGSAITINGDGQYTLTFDCSKNLSDTATVAGVTGLNNLTAVYIKDEEVTNGTAKKTPLSSCNIMFDKVVVDGVSLTITQEEPKSALKSSGILDTNDPLNSWDGSQVEEVSVVNHVLNMEGIENPQVISVTFTLSDVVFSEAEVISSVIDVDSLQFAAQSGTVPGDTGILDTIVSVTPADSGAKITFVSADSSIAYVDATTIAADSTTGKVTCHIVGLKSGETEIYAYAENGVTAKLKVTVEEPEIISEDGADQKADTSDTVTVTGESQSSFNSLPFILAGIIALGVIAIVILFVRYKKES